MTEQQHGAEDELAGLRFYSVTELTNTTRLRQTTVEGDTQKRRFTKAYHRNSVNFRSKTGNNLTDSYRALFYSYDVLHVEICLPTDVMT